MLGRHILKFPRSKSRSQGNWFHSWERREQSVHYPKWYHSSSEQQLSHEVPCEFPRVPISLTIKEYWGQEPQSLEDVSRLSIYQKQTNRSLRLASVFIPETSESYQSPDPTSQ